MLRCTAAFFATQNGGVVSAFEAEEREKRGRPGLIHQVSDVGGRDCGRDGGHDNDVRGPAAHSSENRYEWVLIHETWPVQKVQSKNAVSSSDCTTAL